MEPKVKVNTGKLTAGSIVSFKYKNEQTTGIVYPTNSTHDVYIVKYISTIVSKTSSCHLAPILYIYKKNIKTKV